MARYNEIEIGRIANYTIAAVEQSEDGSYWMISVKNSSGVLEFNRLFIRDEEFVTEHEVGSTIELVPWTMPIIPIKRPNRNGEIRTLRSISGLAFSETEAQSAALRNMQNLYDQAVEIVLKNRRASISLVQRHLRIGYNRSARLIEAMEKAGLVSAMDGRGGREVLARREEN